MVKFEYDADEGNMEFYMDDILLGKASGKKGSATMYPVVCL